MRILLDECVPWPMRRLLSQHSVTSVQAQGWSGIRNSELLRRADADFDLFITSDQNIRYSAESGWSKNRHPGTLNERPSSDSRRSFINRTSLRTRFSLPNFNACKYPNTLLSIHDLRFHQVGYCHLSAG